jgi:2-dehydro-3-deoxyphosphogluconate aldolase/(4S)-4-hydroxy-2-oxoglutarate aldolase
MMKAIFEELRKIGIIPVIKIDDIEKAVPLARALAKGGILCAEITFRTAQGFESLRRIHAEAPEIFVGAGTVLTTEQVDKAAAAGAAFIVSPGFNPKVVCRCLERDIPVVPGCAIPSDMERALEMGLEAVKFFPAEQAGGLSYIKAVSGPYPSLKFIPTGGINADNIASYTKYEKILAVGGSWMVSADLIDKGDFDTITALCRDAVARLLGFSMVHIGINTENEEAAKKAAKLFEAMFGLSVRETSASLFAGDGIEIMKAPGMGTHGHIAISTNSVVKAKYHLEQQGFTFNKESAKYDAKGMMTLVYIQDEIAGFAVHLLQRK